MRIVLLIIMIINLIIMICLLIATISDIKQKEDLVKGIDYLKAYNEEQEQDWRHLYDTRLNGISDKITELYNALYYETANRGHVSIEPDKWTTKNVGSEIHVTDASN